MIPHTTDALALLESGVFIERNLIKAELEGGFQGVWNDDYDLDFEGVIYKGLINFAISPLTSTNTGSIEGISLRFAGLDQDALNLLDGTAWHQKPIYLKQLIIDPQTKAITLALNAFAGRIDQALVKTESDGTATLEVACESWDRDKQRIVGGARASANQTLLNPADKFFEFVASVTHQKLRWGA